MCQWNFYMAFAITTNMTSYGFNQCILSQRFICRFDNSSTIHVLGSAIDEVIQNATMKTWYILWAIFRVLYHSMLCGICGLVESILVSIAFCNLICFAKWYCLTQTKWNILWFNLAHCFSCSHILPSLGCWLKRGESLVMYT